MHSDSGPTLHNKQVLLGVTGGIAAYKSAELIRRLQELSAEVRVVMTQAAQEFITPLTLQALSGHPVHLSLLDPEAEAAMGHIELARWADVVVIAPASADFISRLVHGAGDDLLTTLCLATKAPIAVAPAMNQAMWLNKATQDNMSQLRQRGVTVFGPAQGEQACGDIGPGRMWEPVDIAHSTARLFQTGSLAGKKVVITAGPTQEAIDPVRFISNHSSGKMGYAVAQAAMDAGAITVLISGPSHEPPPPRVQLERVVSAEQMHQASLAHGSGCDVFIAAAAVADFRPQTVATQKMKKGSADTMTIELVKNPDIVAGIAKLDPKPLVVGFSAETENLLVNARDKLQRKQLDLIVANDVSDQTIGFNSEDNAATLVWAEREQVLDKRSKKQLARDIIEIIAAQLRKA